MREILFRGFCPNENGTTTITVDSKQYKGDWVYRDFNRPCNIVYEKIGYDEVLKQDNVPIWHDYPVIPETVGQFTGLTDRKDKNIFEGDRVNCQFDDCITGGSDTFGIREVWYGSFGHGSAIGFCNGLPCCGALEVIGTVFDEVKNGRDN